MSQQTVIFVLGMHRSGTSAATRVLNLMGAELGSDLLAAKDDNPEGFWEHAQLVAINDKILAALGFYWDATLPLPENWHHTPEVLALKSEAVSFLKSEFASVPVFALKDPRLCRTLPFWLEVAKELGALPKALLVFRKPWEIAGSLGKRDGFAPEQALILSALHTLEAERYSRELKRVAISYDALLEKPLEVAAGVAEALGLQLTDTAKSEITGFIKPGLRHHKAAATHPKVEHVLEGIVTDVEALEAELVRNPAPAAQAEAIRDNLETLIQRAANVVKFWHDGAMKTRKIATELHERNCYIIELEAERNMYKEHLGIAYQQLQNYDFVLNNFKLLRQDLERTQQALVAVRNSTSWKVTAPMRLMVRLLHFRRKIVNPQMYRKAFAIWRHYGTMALIRRAAAAIWNPELLSGDYDDWIRQYDTPPLEAIAAWEGQQEQFRRRPLISIVMPVYNVAENWLREAIDSVRAQIYTHWELCIADDASTLPHIRRVLEEYTAADPRIKVTYREQNGHISESSNTALSMATGEYVALMDHDDLIPKTALFHVVSEINDHPDVDLIYSDEDKVDTSGRRFHPHFKPDFNRDLLYATNIFSHFGVYRRSILEKIGGFRKGYEGAQDYDLLLRAMPLVEEKNIRHIPRILYHWRTIPGSTSLGASHKNYADDAGVRALAEHLKARYPEREIGIAPTIIPTLRRLIWSLPEMPLVSIIIPTRNRVEILEQCVRSILKKTLYPNYEIIIVDNQSDDPQTLAFFARIVKESTKVRVLPYPHPFNYSAINNFAVAAAKGEVIALLNNDVEVMDHDIEGRCWLTELVSHATRKEVGAVGAKLYYPDGTAQHAGVLMGMGRTDEAVAGHMMMGLRKEDAGYFGRAIVTQEMSGVTAACMVMRKDVFEQVGRLDEKNLPVAFNDVDLCLRITEAGYKIIWTPFAELYHYESYSRGKEDTPEKAERAKREIDYMRSKWGARVMNDPHYNPNLDYLGGRFLLAFPPRTVM